jgi:hypothetical protein
MEQALSTIPSLKGKELFIDILALGGYKQPEQLFTVSITWPWVPF